MNPTHVERWLPIPGYSGYYSVSDLGRMRSEPRVIQRRDGTNCSVRERIMKTHTSRHGYPMCTLRTPQMEYRHHSVHRLVALAFLGPCPEGMEVCHQDGNRANPRLDNLRYDTHVNNMSDKKRHGTHTLGEVHSRATLTDAQVYEIRAHAAEKALTQSQIGALYGVGRENVCGIHTRRLWAHRPEAA